MPDVDVDVDVVAEAEEVGEAKGVAVDVAKTK